MPTLSQHPRREVLGLFVAVRNNGWWLASCNGLPFGSGPAPSSSVRTASVVVAVDIAGTNTARLEHQQHQEHDDDDHHNHRDNKSKKSRWRMKSWIERMI